jgi:uncharacterized membrane protein
MNTSIVYHSCLILHLTGLTIMAGTTLIDFIGYQTFWKLYSQEKEKANGILNFMNKFSRLIGIGAALLIFTGFGMMILTHGIFGEQIWFRIKFGLVIILIANSLLVGRRLGIKLRKLIHDNEVDLAPKIDSTRINLNRFYITQLSIFFIIIFLSVFKFN